MLNTLHTTRGMVTAPHHLAAASGAAVLREGGNAIEAMVAMAATIAVVYPHMNSIGGDGFWLIHVPGREPIAIDACGRAAGLATPAFYRERGHSAIPSRGPLAANTVAGAISGWQAALDQSASMGGRIPVSRLLADALSHAREGNPVTASQHTFTTKFLNELGNQPGFAKQFLNADGSVPNAMSVRRYESTAQTLERLGRAGLDDFYRGDLARAIAAEHERLGSPLRLADLENHRASMVEPLQVRLRDATLRNLPPPTQGAASLMILGIFDQLHAQGRAPKADSFEFYHHLVEATKQAFLIRNRLIADPATMREDIRAHLTGDALDRMAGAVHSAFALPWPVPALKGDTVWMGAADKSGMMVSFIQSVYWEFGSGVVLSDTGIPWQNRGSSFSLDPTSHLVLQPGKKPFHTLNPAMAHFDDGRVMVYGNMGGDGQPQSQSAVFSRYGLYGQSLQQAITAPRWLLGKTWGQDTTTLKLEARINPSIVQALRAAGHDVEVLEDFTSTMGHAGALVHHPGGIISGAADPRSDGIAVSA